LARNQSHRSGFPARSDIHIGVGRKNQTAGSGSLPSSVDVTSVGHPRISQRMPTQLGQKYRGNETKRPYRMRQNPMHVKAANIVTPPMRKPTFVREELHVTLGENQYSSPLPVPHCYQRHPRSAEQNMLSAKAGAALIFARMHTCQDASQSNIPVMTRKAQRLGPERTRARALRVSGRFQDNGFACVQSLPPSQQTTTANASNLAPTLTHFLDAWRS